MRCRQSSSAHTRSGSPRLRAQSSSCDEPGLARGDRLLAEMLPIGRVDGGEGVGVLVCVRSDQDHSYRPFIDWSVVWADRRLTRVTWGVFATLLSGQAGGPLRATAASDTTETGQAPDGVDTLSGSQLAADPKHPTAPAGQQHRQPGRASMTVTLSATAEPSSRRPFWRPQPSSSRPSPRP